MQKADLYWWFALNMKIWEKFSSVPLVDEFWLIFPREDFCPSTLWFLPTDFGWALTRAEHHFALCKIYCQAKYYFLDIRRAFRVLRGNFTFNLALIFSVIQDDCENRVQTWNKLGDALQHLLIPCLVSCYCPTWSDIQKVTHHSQVDNTVGIYLK